jgi:glutamyl-tRNA synthetase
MSEVRVRFAPSPTGYLHVGGARTALFNWLFARKHRGRFLLRIEDTDRERSTPQAIEAIFEGLRWLGLDWDEEPVFQSARILEHQALVRRLLDVGAAYPCFCDPERLAQQQAAGGGFGYPGTCRALPPEEAARRIAAGEPHAVRFRTPEGETVFADGVHGEIRTRNREISDFILLRRDGTPVYQVAVVADDVFMGITHIIRGDDHITNTPKQILIYQALGLSAPKFAHVPLILGPDKKRLSKRHGATSITEYRERGILPQAMRNFLALLGWNPGDDRELLSLEELIQAFSIEGIHPSGAVFDEAKLDWMNGKYIAALDVAEVWAGMKPFLRDWLQRESMSRTEVESRPLLSDEMGLKLAALFRERLRRFSEAPQKTAYFFRDPEKLDEKGKRKYWQPPLPDAVRILTDRLKEVEPWTREALEQCFDRFAGERNLSRSDLIHPVRLAVTGGTASPGIFEVLEILGRETTLRRLQKALQGEVQ